MFEDGPCWRFVLPFLPFWVSAIVNTFGTGWARWEDRLFYRFTYLGSHNLLHSELNPDFAGSYVARRYFVCVALCIPRYLMYNKPSWKLLTDNFPSLG
jgi:hypothetical protein